MQSGMKFQERVALRVRQLQNLLSVGKDRTFGIISAYRGDLSKSVNQARHGQLIADLQRAGYRRITPLKGKWEGVSEKAVLIPNIAPGVLFELGKKFKQDSVIYKSADGVLGMYYTTGAPKAEVAVNPEGDAAFDIATDDQLYSKARGLSFEFGFLWGQDMPWDGSTPITRKQLRQFVKHQVRQARKFRRRLRFW